MAITKTNWQKLLSPDSQIPPDVFFRVKGEDEGNDSRKPIGAHRFLLAGVSPFFMGMLFGPMKDTREVIEVSGTTHEAFNTMINYIYHPPGSQFFPDPYDDDYYEDSDDEEAPFNPDKIGCPQKFFELLNLGNMYQITSLVKELESNALETLAITNNNVIFAARVARNYRRIFEDISTKMFAKCLKFLFQENRRDLIVFWSLVSNSEDSEKVVPLKERLAGTPFANLDMSHHDIKAMLDKVGRTSYEKCLYLACSKDHVR